jgi:hypothetical protein
MISNAFTRKDTIGTSVRDVMEGRKRYTATAKASERRKRSQYTEVDFFSIILFFANIDSKY